MDKKTKDFFITGAITWSVMLQCLPLVAAFDSAIANSADTLNKAQPLSNSNSACVPEEASRENHNVYGANCP